MLYLLIAVQIDDWDNFNVFKFAQAAEGRPLAALTMTVLEKLDLIDRFNIDRTKMVLFLRDLELQYCNNPYHSNIHAADVVHCVYIMVIKVSCLHGPACLNHSSIL